MSKVQTDNSHFDHKVNLRLKFLPDKNDIAVLDLYHGDGRIWDAIKKISGKNIKILGIDLKQKDKSIIYLKGDNVKFIESLDISKFDIIDLDAYGVPNDQMVEIFKKNVYDKIYFVTFIQTLYGGINKKIIMDIGYNSNMIKKCPSLFNKNGFIKLKRWLCLNGVSEIRYIKFSKKYYVYFKR